MNKLAYFSTFVFLLLIGNTTSLSAQKTRKDLSLIPSSEQKWSIRVGYTTPSGFLNRYHERGNYGVFGVLPNEVDLTQKYNCHDLNQKSFGSINLGVDYRINRWLYVSLDNMGYCLQYELLSENQEVIGVKNAYAISAVASVRFIYLNRPMVRLYSSLGYGVVRMINFDMITPNYSTLEKFSKVCTVGVEYGKDIFGYFEVGGILFPCIRAGLGYKF